jgi:phosphoribosylaminoimidazolecarboxamide formyltransferase/IMP cyclohydrolase
VAIREGIRAIVQPGGSMRDFEVIKACNEADPQVTMVFTQQRAFKH